MSAALRPRLRVLALAGVAALAVALAGWLPRGPETHRLRFRSDWDTGRVTQHADGGWSVLTDLGYEVDIERGWLVAHSVELIACPDVEEVANRSWLESIGPRVAHAGHGDDPVSPTKILVSRVEDLGRPAAVDLGSVEIDGSLIAPAYCEGFYLVAPATSASSAPAAVAVTADQVGASLILEGAWRDSASGVEQPLRLRTELAWGGAGALGGAGAEGLASTTASWRPSDSRGEAVITVERDLGALFDGIDLATADERTIARSVLRSLSDGQRWSIDAGPARK